MFSQFFRPFNFICNIFGLPKPTITVNGKSNNINIWQKLWAVIVAGGLISSFSFAKERLMEFDGKNDMKMIPDINDLVANIIIILINLLNSEEISINVKEMFDTIFKDVNIDGKVLKLFAYKMYLWYFIPMIVFLILIVLEITYSYPPYIFVIRIPTFLSIMHLIMHLFLILALVKVINQQLSRTLLYHDKGSKMMCNENFGKRFTIKYIVFNSIEFIEVGNDVHFDLKLLCKIYDNLSTCIHLLEKCYGLQIFLSIWLMFTSGVVGVTVIVTNKATLQWLVILETILPFFWCFIGCYINDQISKEVNQTITLIIKCLIDFRCVPSRKPVLETFKELVNNDRLQFTACSLFKLSYSMLLGTMLNVITYSIILIQMF